MAKSKFTYAKCPYYKSEYREKLFSGRDILWRLAAYGENREITYAKCLSEISDVIHIVPTFLNVSGAYYSPVLSMDSIETNLIRIFVRKAKIKVMCRLSDFEFEIIK